MTAFDHGVYTPTPRPYVDPVASPGDRSYATWIHLGGLIAWFVAGITSGVAFWVPLVLVLALWLARNGSSPFIHDHGREAFNFQVSMLIWGVLALVVGLLMCGVGWLVTVPAVAIFGVIAMIFASVRASQGQYHRYPMCLRLIP